MRNVIESNMKRTSVCEDDVRDRVNDESGGLE